MKKLQGVAFIKDDKPAMKSSLKSSLISLVTVGNKEIKIHIQQNQIS